MPASSTARSSTTARRSEPNRVVDVACLEELVTPVLDEHGVELVELVWAGGQRGAVLRVTISRGSAEEADGVLEADAPFVPDLAQGGVTLDDCADVSRAISRRFDQRLEGGDDALESLPSFDLEVSSPGVERPLVRLGDYRRFRGALTKVKLAQPLPELPSARVLRGRLLGTRGDIIVIHADGQAYNVPFAQIREAHLVYELPQQKKPGGKPPAGGRVKRPANKTAKKGKGAAP